MQLDDFNFDLASHVGPPNHMAVCSGWSTIAPRHGTVCGVTRLFAPPFVAADLSLSLRFEIDGHLIDDAGSVGKGDVGLLYSGGQWCCHQIIRRGTYHHRFDGKLFSIAVTSRLVPLHGREGFGLQVTLANRCGRAVKLAVIPQLQPGAIGKVELGDWRFYPPAGDTQAQQESADRWSAGGMSLHLMHAPPPAQLDAGTETTCTILCLATQQGAIPAPPADLSDWLTPTTRRWQQLVCTATRCIPQIKCDLPELEWYYLRSLASGLVCIWDNPAFDHQPFLAVSGIDGGGVCEYMWDSGDYIPHTLTLMLGEKVLPILTRLADLAVHATAMTPSGETFGHPYSYNGHAMIEFLAAAVTHGIATSQHYHQVRDRFLAWDASAKRCGDLVDYGRQRNLLEMRGAGWEHLVASPNAERAWCYNMLAQLAEHFGETPPAAWRDTARRIRRAIREKLWDPKRGWFRCLDEHGHEEIVYSIQAFDVIRADACDQPMTDALLSHLRDGAFLGPCGVSSVSREDPLHYELNDPDWSGGGAYVGEGPMLAQMLWQRGRGDLAWDVLKRHLWMGRHLPYYPQEHYCDRPATPAHKRANCCAGLTGLQAIIFGLAGVRPQLDGSIHFAPDTTFPHRIELSSLTLRDHSIDITLEPGTARIQMDGKEVIPHQP